MKLNKMFSRKTVALILLNFVDESQIHKIHFHSFYNWFSRGKVASMFGNCIDERPIYVRPF